ncbi:VOC family protein [Actinotalea sp. K2]|uniref:VOC family protein n=1 Tax=Actinotalea sp. K2 TaxID=2939438 RepID=UPI0020180B52|nr:VOC family protein [Actinotalea sp. K2]MCL3860604.1 VOC family protein [Actinotalea sp. K2]
MTLGVAMVTFDARDARSLAGWWARQVGGEVLVDDDAEFVVVDPGPAGGPRLAFQRVAEPTVGKNRIHLDLETGDRELEVERLLGDGALEVARHETAGFGWVVLADPEGNQFCVSQRH